MAQQLLIHVGGPLQESGSGSLTAQVFVQLDGIYFPEARWTDFVDILLSWLRLLDEPGDMRVLQFLEGPYEVRLEDYGDDRDLALLVFIVRMLTGGRVEAHGVVSKTQLREALEDACRRMAALLRESGYDIEAQRFERAARR